MWASFQEFLPSLPLRGNGLTLAKCHGMMRFAGLT